ncbi:MAG TPA: DUF2520 domain-containing protein [Flavobacteriales bacterium]|jgi:predicted short-subunit dehydrogenase-like oxidoreductase (DUF2520 family)
MKFSIAGSGNVAWHFANMFIKGGHDLLQVYARNEEAGMALADEHGAEYLNDASRFSSDNDFILVAVSDRSIAEVASAIGKEFFVIHTSGGSDMDVIPQSKRGVIWPIQSMIKGNEVEYNRVPFLIEASVLELQTTLMVMMQNISGRVMVATSEQRRKAHVAAVFANNFTNALYTIAEDILGDNNLPSDLLLPLMEGHWNNLKKQPASKLQTGPAVRNDRSTIQNHLQQLADQPQQAEVYRLLSEFIYKRFYGEKF